MRSFLLPIIITLFLTLYYTCYFYLSIIIARACFYQYTYIFYLTALSVFCLLVYSSLCSFDHFIVCPYTLYFALLGVLLFSRTYLCLLIHIWLWFQHNTFLSSARLGTVGKSRLILFCLFGPIEWIFVIHSNIWIIYT